MTIENARADWILEYAHSVYRISGNLFSPHSVNINIAINRNIITQSKNISKTLFTKANLTIKLKVCYNLPNAEHYIATYR